MQGPSGEDPSVPSAPSWTDGNARDVTRVSGCNNGLEQDWGVRGHVGQGSEQPVEGVPAHGRTGIQWALRSRLTKTMLNFWDSMALNGQEQQEPLSSILCCHRHLLLN